MVSRRPSLANFADTIKIAIIFSKTIFKYSIKVEKKKLCIELQLLFPFCDGTELVNLW